MRGGLGAFSAVLESATKAIVTEEGEDDVRPEDDPSLQTKSARQIVAILRAGHGIVGRPKLEQDGGDMHVYLPHAFVNSKTLIRLFKKFGEDFRGVTSYARPNAVALTFKASLFEE